MSEVATKVQDYRTIKKPMANITSGYYRNRIKNYKPKTELFYENNRFIVKTASTAKELEKVLKLRHDVYYKELLNCCHPLNMDVDRFDFNSDHIIVINKKNDEVVGTYRIKSSDFSDKFYSSTEFDIRPIKNLNGTKIEIGRACVHADYRNLITISLLWKGILRYAQQKDAKWLFGCSSIKTTDPVKAVNIYKYLGKTRSAITPVTINPKRSFRVPNFKNYMEKYYKDSKNEPEHPEKMLPALLKFYIHSGAQICGEPAYDKEFRCIDFMTLLNLDRVNAKLQKKFA